MWEEASHIRGRCVGGEGMRPEAAEGALSVASRRHLRPLAREVSC